MAKTVRQALHYIISARRAFLPLKDRNKIYKYTCFEYYVYLQFYVPVRK
jgi:hypothetical protein